MKVRGRLSRLRFHTLESRRLPQSSVISPEFQADSAAQFLINTEHAGRMFFYPTGLGEIESASPPTGDRSSLGQWHMAKSLQESSK